jgi:hypothetical protein
MGHTPPVGAGYAQNNGGNNTVLYVASNNNNPSVIMHTGTAADPQARQGADYGFSDHRDMPGYTNFYGQQPAGPAVAGLS